MVLRRALRPAHATGDSHSDYNNQPSLLALQVDGLAFCRAVRALELSQGVPRTTRLPFITLTADVGSATAVQCKAAGADAVMHKQAVLKLFRKRSQ